MALPELYFYWSLRPVGMLFVLYDVMFRSPIRNLSGEVQCLSCYEAVGTFVERHIIAK